MKTLDWVIDHYDELESPLDKRFITRLADFLPTDKCRLFGIHSDRLIPYNKENILMYLQDDLLWGWDKANNKRGLSSNIGYDLVRAWNIILENGLEDFTDYEPYGMPLFEVTAGNYGWDLPVYEHKHYDEISVLWVRPHMEPALIKIANNESQVNKYTHGKHVRIPYDRTRYEFLILANDIKQDKALEYNRSVYSSFLDNILKQMATMGGVEYNPKDAIMELYGDFLLAKYDSATEELIPLTDADIDWLSKEFSCQRK